MKLDEIAELEGVSKRYVSAVKAELRNKNQIKNHKVLIDSRLKQLEIDRNYYKKKYDELLQELHRYEDFITLLEDRINKFESVAYPRNYDLSNNENDLEGILLLSDLHIGEVVNLSINKFNINIAIRRMEILADKVISKIKQLKLNRLWIFALGDIVTGGIHDELLKTNEMHEVDQTIIASNLIALFLRDIASHISEIKFIGIVGNHGRLTKKYEYKNITNSFDYLTYKLVEIYLSNQKNIEFVIPKEKQVIVEVKKYNFLLSHGDTIKGWNGIPFYGIERYSSNVRRVYNNLDTFIHCIVHGHFHVPYFQINSGKDCKIINGSLKGVDEYTLNKSMYSEACQVLFTTSSTNLVEDVFIIWLKEDVDKPCRYNITNI